MKVNEIFGPTIQGEGKSTGKEVLFLRLAMCNLHCVWCDTKYTWDWANYDKSKELHEMNVSEVVERLEVLNLRSLVISGGEPLLQQKELITLLKILKSLGYWVEIETNGTIKPNDEFLALVDQINCSPKLSNCGDPKKFRVRNEALEVLSRSEKTFFKFVVSNKTDLVEVEEYIRDFSMNPTRIYLMPLGKTREELELTTRATEQLAEEHSLNFSRRLHVELFGSRRGV